MTKALEEKLEYIWWNKKADEQEALEIIKAFIQEHTISKERVEEIIDKSSCKGDSGYCGRCEFIKKALDTLLDRGEE